MQPQYLTPTDQLHRLFFADSLHIAVLGGCGLCDTEHDEMCVGCGQCRCHVHDTCRRPTETDAPGGAR